MLFIACYSCRLDKHSISSYMDHYVMVATKTGFEHVYRFVIVRGPLLTKNGCLTLGLAFANCDVCLLIGVKGVSGCMILCLCLSLYGMSTTLKEIRNNLC